MWFDLVVLGLLFLDFEPLAECRYPAVVRAQALQQIGHLYAVEVEEATAAGALDGQVADGLAEVAVHQGLFLEQRRLEAVGGDVARPHRCRLSAVVGLHSQEELGGGAEVGREGCPLPGAGAAERKGAHLPQRAVAQGVAARLQDEVGDVLLGVVGVAEQPFAVVPFLKAQLKAGVADALQAHQRRPGCRCTSQRSGRASGAWRRAD